MFKISCSISVPYFLLLAENQTSGSQNLLLGGNAQGQPQVGQLVVLQAGKLRAPAELPTLLGTAPSSGTEKWWIQRAREARFQPEIS